MARSVVKERSSQPALRGSGSLKQRRGDPAIAAGNDVKLRQRTVYGRFNGAAR